MKDAVYILIMKDPGLGSMIQEAGDNELVRRLPDHNDVIQKRDKPLACQTPGGVSRCAESTWRNQKLSDLLRSNPDVKASIKQSM
tara:strand:+ start:98 stop:352 length:255 start_codon:yes stop_codon:yes gene_type:complete